MKEQVLFVDDDGLILQAMKRAFRQDVDLAVLTASNAREAMQIIRETEIPVIVSDQDMPGMSGIEFLEWAKRARPDSIRILLTGFADFGVAINSINRCEVYRFIAKPWNTKELRATVREALQKYRVIACLKSGHESKLLSLVRTIELKDPYTRGHSERVAEYSIQLADAMGLSPEEKSNLRFGGFIHDIGKIGISETILNKREALTTEEREIIKQHSRWSGEVAEMAGLHPGIVNVALYHHERFDGKGYPGGLAGNEIPVLARIASIADVYDAMALDRPYRKGMDHAALLEYLKSERHQAFDPEIADLFIAEMKKRRKGKVILARPKGRESRNVVRKTAAGQW